MNPFKQSTFQGPTRMLLHSVEGFGKTTLAAFFPNPAFICGERAFPRDLGFAPFHSEPKTWQDVIAIVRWLTESPHDFGSVVFDTFDWIGPMIQRYVCERDTGRKTEMNPRGLVLESIEDYGYGKGYIVEAEEVRKLLSLLDELQAKRAMHVVVLMHSWVKTFNNPAGENFDRWQPKMHERSARVLVEWAENVLFGYFEVLASKSDPKDRKAKGVSTQRRILGTRHSALYDAKNRFNLPDTIELGNPKELMPYLLGVHLNPPPAHALTPPIVKSEEQKRADEEAKRAAEKRYADGHAAIAASVEPKLSAREEQEGPQAAPSAVSRHNAVMPREPREAAASAPVVETNSNALDEATQADINAMLVDCREKLGQEYALKVMGWITQAQNDAKKIDKIFATVTKDINKATAQQLANA